MEKIIIHPRLVTATELDPMTAMALNTRFAGFLSRLAQEIGVNYANLATVSRRILQDADIPQAMT